MASGRRVAAFAIVIPDYDAAIEFYVNQAGFVLIEDTRLSPDKRWVLVAPAQDAETRILLARADGPAQAAAVGNQTGGRVGFFLHTDDFIRDHAAMTAAGVVFEEAPRQEPYGMVAVWRDPWGNRWDLIEFRREAPAV